MEQKPITILLLPDETGLILEHSLTDKQGRKRRIWALNKSPEGHLIFEIYKWEEFDPNLFFVHPIVAKVMELPAFDKYIHRLASGKVSGEEELLGHIDFRLKNGDEAKMDVTAIQDLIDIRYINQTTLQIKLPLLAVCEECGKIYERKREDQKYCEDKCGSRVRMRAYRERKKGSAK